MCKAFQDGLVGADASRRSGVRVAQPIAQPGLHMGTSLMCMPKGAALAAIMGWIAAD